MSNIANEYVDQAPRAGTGTPFSIWLALAVGILVGFSWFFQSGLMVGTGIILVVTAWCLLIKPENRLTLIITLVILAILFLVALPNYIRIKDKAKNAEIKQNLHAIQLGLERFAVDHSGSYPLAIDVLRDDEYLPWLPVNPYARGKFNNLDTSDDSTGWKVILQMQPLGDDYFPAKYQAQLTPIGNFCYVPRLETGADGELTATGYLLLAFGQKRWHPDWTTPPRNIPIVLLQLTNEDSIPQPY